MLPTDTFNEVELLMIALAKMRDCFFQWNSINSSRQKIKELTDEILVILTREKSRIPKPKIKKLLG